MSRDAVKAGLEALATAKLISTEPDDDTQWVVSDPQSGLSTLLESRQADLERQQSQLHEARSAVAGLLLDINGNRPLSAHTVGVDRVVGVEAVRDRLDALSRKCQSEVWSFNPGGPQTEAGMRAARALSEETLDRGVDMRCIYLESAKNEELTRQHVQWIAERGAQVRLSPTLPTRMLLIDRSIAVVPIDSDNTASGALVITEPGIVSNMIALYGAFWKAAKPLSAQRKREGTGLSKQDLAAVSLWAQGHTDSTVARKLGVSERTIRRIHDRVTEYLGSTSRFQSGARSVAEGLIEPEDLI
ncbi:helix-turn-helix domain-containing protein [Glycomyces rhizosphaerae]|uniref:Helix-turn-helix domain-containing protein n=1 Tax=Glycomyces rhizosphaerae TaxID=2054422 RepID=A0ABV7Q4T9_9ACTN